MFAWSRALVTGSDGKPIQVAFADWEEELIRGAQSEHADGDENAIADCAEILHRSLPSIWSHIRYVNARERFRQERVAKVLPPRVVHKAIKPDEPFIRPLTIEQLTAGSARVRTYNGWSTP